MRQEQRVRRQHVLELEKEQKIVLKQENPQQVEIFSQPEVVLARTLPEIQQESQEFIQETVSNVIVTTNIQLVEEVEKPKKRVFGRKKKEEINNS